MTKDEVGSAIALLKFSHKGYFEKMSHQEKLSMLESWYMALKDYKHSALCNAVNDLLKESTYVPKLADVVAKLNAGNRYKNVTAGCDICDRTGMIHYSKPFDYGGSVGVMDMTYFCRCSCNADAESRIPTYREVFGFDPVKKKVIAEPVNISQLRKEFQKWAAVTTKK